MIDFKTLKQNRARSLEKLSEKVANQSRKREADTRFWSPTVDKAGNGYAVLRFIGPPKGEEDEYVRYWDHGFQGPGGWYIEKSLTSIGMDDPVSDYNSKLWNSGSEDDKKQARAQKRRLKYVANVYVVRDSGNPENEGKVFLFQFGKKIFDKLNDAMHPQFEDEEPINPFDLWGGADFKLKIRTVEEFRNYDSSEFDAAAPLKIVGKSNLSEDEHDKELEKVWLSCHPLKEFLDPANYKSYEELERQLMKVLSPRGSRDEEQERPARSQKEAAPREEESKFSSPKEEAEEEQPPFDLEEVQTSESEDSDIAYFKNIAKKRRG